MGVALGVLPDVCAVGSVELADVGQQGLQARPLLQAREHRTAGDVIKGSNRVDGQHRRTWIHFGGDAQETDQRFRACAGAKAILKRHAGSLELGRVLLCKGAPDQAAEHVPDYQRPHPPVGLAEGDNTARSDGSDNRRWHICTCKPLGSTVQECAVSLIVEHYPQMLVGNA